MVTYKELKNDIKHYLNIEDLILFLIEGNDNNFDFFDDYLYLILN
jgi:hypothetical protein